MKKILIGAIMSVSELLSGGAEQLRALGLNACQVKCWDDALYTTENVRLIREKTEGIALTSLWAGWPGPKVWDFMEGPQTLGLVPKVYRQQRLESLKRGMAFADALDIQDVVTHVGFIPENPGSEAYQDFIAWMQPLVEYFRSHDMHFGFETGQETPVTLLRTIQDLGGTPDLWINLDPANLLMYGKANPVDAVGIYGQYIRSVHVKDGCYPTQGDALGEEKPIGEGMVHFEKLISALKAQGYMGPYIIEREISGEEQIRDIARARDQLLALLND